MLLFRYRSASVFEVQWLGLLEGLDSAGWNVVGGTPDVLQGFVLAM